jgi:hypothetical protein
LTGVPGAEARHCGLSCFCSSCSSSAKTGTNIPGGGGGWSANYRVCLVEGFREAMDIVSGFWRTLSIRCQSATNSGGEHSVYCDIVKNAGG